MVARLEVERRTIGVHAAPGESFIQQVTPSIHDNSGIIVAFLSTGTDERHTIVCVECYLDDYGSSREEANPSKVQ